MNDSTTALEYPANKLAIGHARMLDAIRHRWSPRAYSDRAVTSDDLTALFDAASWSASCFGEEPWRFIVASKDKIEEYQKMLGCLVEFNQSWAKNAPVLFLTVTSKNFAHNNKPNGYAMHDVGMALATLMIQASSMGMHAHAMGGFDRDKARSTYNIPEDYDLGAAVAVGYVGDHTLLPEGMQKTELAPRKRKPLSETLFSGTWANPAAL